MTVHPTPHRPIGFWLKLVDRLIDERSEATLGKAGFSRRHWQLLNTLDTADRTSEELDEAVRPFLDADAEETTAPHLRPLLEQGIVEQHGDLYRLTPHGHEVLTRLRQEGGKNRSLVVKGIEPDEYVRTLGTLETMARNLGWTP